MPKDLSRGIVHNLPDGVLASNEFGGVAAVEVLAVWTVVDRQAEIAGKPSDLPLGQFAQREKKP